MNCPLCNSLDIRLFSNVSNKTYYKCNTCSLIFIDSIHHLNIIEEKTRYSFHKNNIEDNGYVNFLNKVITPAKQFLKKGMHGLDFGCGPNPVLSQLLEKSGYKCDYFDPLFFPRKKKIDYDFIFATECFEHFFYPKKELQELNSILKKGGVLAVMTEIITAKIDFDNWYYIKDPTHVCFYSMDTINFICKNLELKIIYTDMSRVFIFLKKNN